MTPVPDAPLAGANCTGLPDTARYAKVPLGRLRSSIGNGDRRGLTQVMDPMPDNDPALLALRALLDIIDMARRIGSVALRNHDSLHISGRAAQLAGAASELADAYPPPERES